MQNRKTKVASIAAAAVLLPLLSVAPATAASLYDTPHLRGADCSVWDDTRNAVSWDLPNEYQNGKNYTMIIEWKHRPDVDLPWISWPTETAQVSVEEQFFIAKGYRTAYVSLWYGVGDRKRSKDPARVWFWQSTFECHADIKESGPKS